MKTIDDRLETIDEQTFAQSAVGFSAMLDPVHRDRFVPIIDAEENAVVLDSQTIAVNPSEFFDCVTARISRKGLESLDNFESDWFWYRPEIFGDTAFVKEDVQELNDAASLELTQKDGMGDCSSTGGEGMFQIKRVFQVMKMPHQFSVINKRHNDRFCATVLINEELFRFWCHVKSILAFSAQRKRGLDVYEPPAPTTDQRLQTRGGMGFSILVSSLLNITYLF